eukprot:8610606-Pyramimonas_sp.AAC.1
MPFRRERRKRFRSSKGPVPTRRIPSCPKSTPTPPKHRGGQSHYGPPPCRAPRRAASPQRVSAPSPSSTT